MSKNAGKQFEAAIRSMLERDGARVHRNVDAMIGKGYTSVKSLPDLTVFWPDATTALIECKVVKGKALPFNRIPTHQREHLLEFSLLGDHAYGLVAVRFYDGPIRKGSLNRAFLLDMNTIYWAENDLARKSLPLDACVERGAELTWVPGTGWALPTDWKEMA